MKICEYLHKPVLDTCSNVFYLYSFETPRELGSIVSVLYSEGNTSKDITYPI